MPDVHQISAILKVQRGQEADLRPVEEATLTNFILEEQAESDATPSPPPPAKRLRDVLAARKAARIKGSDSKYDPALKHAICGSAAEVERVWSMAGKILTNERSSTSPLLFECIMYLKYNRDLWGLKDVVEANKRRKNNSKSARAKLAADQERVDLQRSEIATWEALGEGSI
jgi:hypothetical protein